MSTPASSLFFLVVLGISILLADITPVSAGSEDTLTLQKWEYCAGCKLTVEHFFRHALEAIRISEADTGRSTVEEPLAFDLEPTIDRLCADDHFRNFVPAMTYGIVHCFLLSFHIF